MNRSALRTALAGLFVCGFGAPFGEGAIVERGPHHRLVRTIEAVRVGNKIVERNRDIVELESGMHRWDGQAWVDVSPGLRIVNGNAVADLFYSVQFAPNLATAGVCDPANHDHII